MFHVPAHKHVGPNGPGQIVNREPVHNVKPPAADFAVQCHGSILSFTPLHAKAKQWLDDNVFAESWQWLGSTLNCDYRVGVQLAQAMEADGLEVV